MQGQDTTKGNVVSLFARKSSEGAAQNAEHAVDPNDESFTDIMERNRKNKERVEKERLNANKSVLRSYRIKN